MFEFNQSMGNLNTTPKLKDIFNDEPYRDLRRRMLTGPDLPKECNKCYVEEQSKSSYRSRSNQKYADIVSALEPDPSGYAEFRQVFIDYRFSNKCNFKCITCGPEFSSSHAVEFAKLPYFLDDNPWKKSPYIEIKTADFFDQFVEFSKDIREIYFAGGEPLMSDHHYDILNYFITTQQPVKIFYNTNFSDLRYKGFDVIDLWSKVNGVVDLFVSIDGYGERGELIRSGLDTEKFEKNVQLLLERKPKNVKLHFSITFGLTNFRDVVDTTKWLDGLVKGNTAITIGYNPIIFAPAFSYLSLTDKQMDAGLALVNEQVAEYEKQDTPSSHIRVKHLRDGFVSFLQNAKNNRNTDIDNIESQIRYLDNIDPMRKTDWKTTLSDMYNDWQEILKSENTND